MKIDGGSKHVKRVGRVAAAVAILLAIAAGALVGGAPSGAQEYTPRCTVAASYDHDAGVLRVIGTNLQAGFTTPILLDGEQIGQATADGVGSFDVQIDVQLEGPVVTQATHVVTILCSEDGDESSTEITTNPPTTTSTIPDEVVHVLEPATIDCAGNLRGFAQVASPGTQVSFTLDHTGEVLAVVDADAGGRAAYAVVVDLAPGTYTVTARGQETSGDPFTLTSSFTVPSGCDELSRTGTDSVPLALTGVAAIGLGSLTLLAARRRGSDAA